VLLIFAAPLALSTFYAMNGIFDGAAWVALFSHPQLWPALQLSVFTGLTSAAVAALASFSIVAGLYQTRWWTKLSAITGAMQSLPHAALAIGMAFLVMPSGFIARLLALIFGWTEPPSWITTHDPYGIALIAALCLKEIPFLIWIVVNILNRDDMQHLFAGQRLAAISLGHGMRSIWLRVYFPQLLPKLIWPLAFVFVYAATVVDMTLIIGPTQPPTLAEVIWSDLNSAQVASNARGGAGAVFLTGAVAAVALLNWSVAKLLSSRRGWLTIGPAARDLIRPSGTFSTLWRRDREASAFPLSLLHKVEKVAHLGRMRSLAALSAVYIIIALTLVLLSFATLWPFPAIVPESLNAAAWLRVLQNPNAILTSVALAIGTVVVAFFLIVVWFESQPAQRDHLMLFFCVLALGLPSLLLGLGEYRAALQFGLTGSAVGLFFAHLIPVTAYMFITMAGSYRSFDTRWKSSAYGLLSNQRRFLWAIKIPMLKAPLLAASAIGFAVSFGQYVPAQLIAAGRYSTLPMEAVTLTSGSNRPLTAAYALLLMGPPLLVFLIAASLSKPRWSRP
jgi:putative thiamine transport system permease protein